MVEKLDQKEIASFEEVLMSNVFTQEALINLLEAKGIIQKSELFDEIKRLRKEQKNSRQILWNPETRYPLEC